MIPANCKHIKKLPKGASTLFRNLLKERGCRLVEDIKTEWNSIGQNPTLYVKLDSGSSAFSFANYPLMCNALVCARHLPDTSSQLAVVLKVRATVKYCLQNIRYD